MTFPKIEAKANPSVTINAFKGINRLPEGADGEGEFVNLVLDDYPAARSECMKDAGKLYIKTDVGAAELKDGGLQYAFEAAYEDGYLYLTGVYDGDFYYKGEKIGYADRPDGNFRIKASDRVEIKKNGTRYIIFAEGENGHSSIWTYNTEGTSAGDELARKNDGLLQSDMIADVIPAENTYQTAWLYKLCITEYDASHRTRLSKYEESTGKSYYMIFPNADSTKTAILSNSDYDKVYKRPIYNQILRGYEKYNEYAGYYGAALYITPKLPEDCFWNPDRYCFDDFFDEHPVRFVVDAAGDDAYSALLENENASFNIAEDTIYKQYPSNPVGIEDGKSKKVYPLNSETLTATSYELFDGTYSTTTASHDGINDFYGIIGHFEKWNEEKRRYEFFGGDEPVYGFVDADGTRLGHGYKKGTDGEDFYNDSKYIYSQTAIEVEFGVMTECTRLNHIAVYQNRVFGTVEDGSMLMFSKPGEYTSFTAYQGASNDSGFLNTASAGEYTGLCEYSDSLIAFKRDGVGIYYGGAASEISLSREVKGAGCIDCRSICEVGGVLIFLSEDGFYSYGGGVPQKISRRLAKRYKSAAALCEGTRYVADCVGEDGEREVLIYDTAFDAWTSMSPPDADVVSCAKNGGLCFALSDGTMITTGGTDGYWKFETMDLFEDMTEDKGINEIYIRARLSGTMDVTTFADGEAYRHAQITGNGGKVRVWRVPVRFIHKNYYRIRLEGQGSCVLYAVERIVYAGGKVR